MRTKHRSHIRYAAPVTPVRQRRGGRTRALVSVARMPDAPRPDGRVLGGVVLAAVMSFGLWAVLIAGMTRIV